MKKRFYWLCIVCLLLSMSSCITRVHQKEFFYYRRTNAEHVSRLQLGGYYYQEHEKRVFSRGKPVTGHADTTVKYISAILLYKDGSVLRTGTWTYDDRQDDPGVIDPELNTFKACHKKLQAELRHFPISAGLGSALWWGAYRIDGDTLKIQSYSGTNSNFVSPFIDLELFEKHARINNDTTFSFFASLTPGRNWQPKPYNGGQYKFYRFSPKPDSTKGNWIKESGKFD